MPIQPDDGPGKYDAECTVARESAQASAAVLIIMGGNRGSGFSMQAVKEMPPLMIAALLEGMAKQIREGAGNGVH